MTEQEIIQGCVRQNRQCQQALFNLYAPNFMSICLRYASNSMEAEDMMQEGFIAIFKNIGQFNNTGSFGGWMKRVIINAALMLLRKNKLRFNEIDDYSNNNNVSIEAYTYSNLGEEDLMKLINNLPKGYRVVFNLNIIEGYNHDEIATMLDIKPATSRSQLVKARKMLQLQILELQKIAV